VRPTARFCQSCGARSETSNLSELDAEETRLAAARSPSAAVGGQTVASRPEEALPRRASSSLARDEQIIFSERPVAFFVFIGYFIAAFVALFLTIALAYLGAGRISPLTCVLFSLPVMLVPLIRHLRRNATLYTLTDSKIEITSGLLSRTTRSIPLHNIQNITVSMSLWQRLLGYGDILIDSFGDLNKSARIYRINAPRRRADEILRAQRQR
jgi:uncharacterized membrane protein YdbT with pleckstrin-like domain